MKKIILSTFLAGTVALSFGGVAYAKCTDSKPLSSCPSGTVWVNLKNGTGSEYDYTQTITVTNGDYLIRLNGASNPPVEGEIDIDGNYVIPSIPNATRSGNITAFGATYQLKDSTVKVVVDKVAQTSTTGSVATLTGDADFKTWATTRGGMNLSRGASWQEFSGDVSLSQVRDWLNPAINPKAPNTPKTIFASMAAYKINLLTVANALGRDNYPMLLYDFNMGRFNADYKVIGPQSEWVTSKMMYDAGVLLRAPDGVFDGRNLEEAAAAGQFPIGVWNAGRASRNANKAFRYPGEVDEPYTASDMAVVSKYSREGYWGKYGSGDMRIEFLKEYGKTILVNFDYTTKTNPNDTVNISKFNSLPLYSPAATTVNTSTQTTNSTATTGTTATTQTSSTASVDTSSESCLSIPMTLSYQSKDSSTNGFVTKLQDFLHATNYLTTVSTGFFGAGTFKAVKAFQGANGISKTGSVGPNTRAKILQISCAMPVQDIAESDAVIPDTGSTSVLPSGCTSTTGFSSTTGVRCMSTSLPEGCTSNTTFSPVTGVRCVVQ